MPNNLYIDIQPDYIDWNDWHSAVSILLESQDVPFVKDEEDWRDFGRAISLSPTYSSYNIPNPDEYLDWRDWARKLIVSLQGLR